MDFVLLNFKFNDLFVRIIVVFISDILIPGLVAQRITQMFGYIYTRSKIY